MLGNMLAIHNFGECYILLTVPRKSIINSKLWVLSSVSETLLLGFRCESLGTSCQSIITEYSCYDMFGMAKAFPIGIVLQMDRYRSGRHEI